MWFRSFFGVPSSITAPDGRPVNAVRGFLDSRRDADHPRAPGRLVVCLDHDWRPQWRVDLIPSYKAHRVEEEQPGGEPDIEEVPDDLTPAGRHDHGDARRVRHRHRGRAGFRGRRRAGHAGRPRAHATRSSSSAVTAICCSWCATTRCRSGCSISAAAWPRRRCSGPPRSPSSYGVPGRPGRAGLRRTGAAARRSVRRAARRAGCRREDRGHAAGAARLAGGHPGCRRTTRNRRCPRHIGRSCSPPPTTSRRPGRWCGWPPTRRSRCLDDSRRAAAGGRSTRARSPNWPQHYGVTSSIGRLQKALDALPD